MLPIVSEENSSAVMTSLELVKIINDLREEGQAELRHDHFTAKIRKVLGDEAPKFSGALKTQSGQTAQGYILPKRECHLMVMSESYKVQAAVYDRMVELEGKQQPIDPMKVLSDSAAMRGLLLTYTEKVLELEHKVETLKPKAEAIDRLTEADGEMNCTVAAKALQIQPKKLFDFLREKHWIYRRAGNSLINVLSQLTPHFLTFLGLAKTAQRDKFGVREY